MSCLALISTFAVVICKYPGAGGCGIGKGQRNCSFLACAIFVLCKTHLIFFLLPRFIAIFESIPQFASLDSTRSFLREVELTHVDDPNVSANRQ